MAAIFGLVALVLIIATACKSVGAAIVLAIFAAILIGFLKR
ncbi:hypothetical protein AEAC466_04530 [Asticcacaulis sp. AC466]|nr:hypothetical protein [Asticcacaulis sp. AC466]ESQ85435.1 hypothetical protein AEAC466_04530 [Asticcacaulis sp. AC466]